jgi:hypothetical protein
MFALQCHQIGSAGLVAVRWAPEIEVGDCAEMNGCFDGLVCRPIFAETDRIVCG